MKTLRKLSKVAIFVLGATFVIGCGGGGGGNSSNGTISFNGFEYKTVTSPTTSKVWLDRNLGAARVCESATDTACYGDYYQWGRSTDGHEDMNSAETTTQALDVNNVGNSLFIKGHHDWAKNGVDNSGALRAANWSKTDGSTVCPAGFRVPTIAEWSAELANIHNAADAYNSFLKLPSSGYRRWSNGNLQNVGIYGALWSATTAGVHTKYVYYNQTNANVSTGGKYRAYGLPVRCIKD